MIKITSNKKMLTVFISKNERIDIIKANQIIKTGKRIIAQNNLNSIVVEVNHTTKASIDGIELLERYLSKCNTIPVIMISS
ncbi:MAG: hypothetical protein H6587_03580 [Flavobacteriales bacterium]|nr:hypothetical protein [Flavobacteriales bacterium]MCB9363630.1 hypothetical protein [Flavobacteriales bacterium]